MGWGCLFSLWLRCSRSSCWRVLGISFPRCLGLCLRAGLSDRLCSCAPARSCCVRRARGGSLRGMRIAARNTDDFPCTWLATGSRLGARSARADHVRNRRRRGGSRPVRPGVSGHVCAELADLQRRFTDILCDRQPGSRAAVGRLAAGLVEADVRGDGRALRLVRDRGSGADRRLAVRQMARHRPVSSGAWRPGAAACRDLLAGPGLRFVQAAECGVHARSIVHDGILSSHRLPIETRDPVMVAWAFGTLAIIYYWVYFLVTFVACGFPLAPFAEPA